MNAVAAGCTAGLILMSALPGPRTTSNVSHELQPAEDVLFVVLKPEAENTVSLIVDRMSDASGREPAAIRMDLEALWAQPPGLYVQLDGLPAPAEVLIRRTSGSDVRIEGETISMRLSAKGPQEVAVVWVREADKGRYTLLVPDFIGHLTVVSNGMTVVSAEPFPAEPDPLVIAIPAN